MSPTVSIVIPCFNAQETIREAIESCLRQSYDAFEVVVVDDGSTDRSVHVLSEFSNDIRWETGENRGGCAARNRGTELATGDYIQYLDADDILHTDKLSLQMEQVLCNPGKLVFSDVSYMDDRKPHPHHRRLGDASDSFEFMIEAGLQTSAPIHRREWLDRVGGWTEGLCCAQERDLHLRLAAIGIPFMRFPRNLVSIRRVEGSVSSSYVRVMDQHEQILSRVRLLLESQGRLNDERLAAMAGLLARDAREFAKHNEWDRATRFFKLALSYHPSGGLESAFPNHRWLARILGGTFACKLRRLIPTRM